MFQLIVIKSLNRVYHQIPEQGAAKHISGM